MRLLSSLVVGCLIIGGLIGVLAWTLSARHKGMPAPSANSDTPQIYDENADGRDLVNAALARAKKENHNVLIQWGGNWCSWCIVLHALYEKDPDIRRMLHDHYELILIDTNDRNMPLVKELGATMDNGVPYLTILDATGKPLVQQETEFLEVKDAQGKSVGVSAGHDPE